MWCTQDWTAAAVVASIKNRFVTGDWKASQAGHGAGAGVNGMDIDGTGAAAGDDDDDDDDDDEAMNQKLDRELADLVSGRTDLKQQLRQQASAVAEGN